MTTLFTIAVCILAGLFNPLTCRVLQGFADARRGDR